MWGARKLEQDILSELETIDRLLTTITRNSTDPRTVEEVVNLARLSTKSLQVMMSQRYANVTRLGNQAHEGRITDLETQVSEVQAALAELHQELDAIRNSQVIQMRTRRAE
jgi:DNA gyrase/topoisomerase IV subunit A